MLDVVKTVVGLALLLGGGELLVRGASRLARSLGVSPLAVGLTVVAFGTSAPELAVNVLAALRDSGELSFGNIVGSNLANIGLIFGLAALVRPIPMENVVVRREIPMMMLATVAAMGMAFDHWFDDEPTFFARSDGFVLLLFFVVFLYYTVGDLLRVRRNNHRALAATLPRNVPETLEPTVVTDLVLAALGLSLLFLGADLAVEGSTSLALALGVPEAVVGLTLIAVGTSLPELAATGVAVWRGEAAMAVGNVVGSNIFNLLLVGGVTSLVRPIPIPGGGIGDLVMLGLLSLALWGVSLSRGGVVRAEGAALLLAYIAYMTFRTLG
jgi:cation:H+ antiporter